MDSISSDRFKRIKVIGKQSFRDGVAQYYQNYTARWQEKIDNERWLLATTTTGPSTTSTTTTPNFTTTTAAAASGDNGAIYGANGQNADLIPTSTTLYPPGMSPEERLARARKPMEPMLEFYIKDFDNARKSLVQEHGVMFGNYDSRKTTVGSGYGQAGEWTSTSGLGSEEGGSGVWNPVG